LLHWSGASLLNTANNERQTATGQLPKIFLPDMARPRYLALTGGVGGAKLALGLSKLLPPGELAFVVNTGDDFTHLGLHISPDLDTLVYTLSGESNPETGWGRRAESWRFMEALEALGGETWFRLGDRDLAMHVERSRRLHTGETLTRVTAALASALGVGHTILPMSDEPVSTLVQTADGVMDFQHYFVRERCQPVVTGFEFRGADEARINPVILEWLDDPGLRGVILCPSNPFVSIDPILQVAGMRSHLSHCAARVIAVSPVVGGAAIKGPTVKMMHELSVPGSADWVAGHYRDVLQGFVLDQVDTGLRTTIAAMKLEVAVTQTVMNSLADRIHLARACLDLIG
ncbi:MAG: 2-phospho-L-lactate transferase, partial [Lysobacterales bacterium]